MTLVEFLRARLDEDEAAAQEATGRQWRRLVDAEPKFRKVVAWGLTPIGAMNEERDADHIARHDPARVLREVEAQRAIVEPHDGTHECPRDGDTCGWWQDDEACDVLRHLASVWSDHPSYDPAWSLDGRVTDE